MALTSYNDFYNDYLNRGYAPYMAEALAQKAFDDYKASLDAYNPYQSSVDLYESTQTDPNDPQILYDRQGEYSEDNTGGGISTGGTPVYDYPQSSPNDDVIWSGESNADGDPMPIRDYEADQLNDPSIDTSVIDTQPSPDPGGGTSIIDDVNQTITDTTGGGGSGGDTAQSGESILAGVPEGYEVWYATDEDMYYLTYYVPDTEVRDQYWTGGAADEVIEGGIPMAWSLDREELDVLLGPDQSIDNLEIRNVTADAMLDAGTTFWGQAMELEGSVENPFLEWENTVVAQASVRPYLRDVEVLTLIAQATLEGRPLDSSEFEQTGWWRSHNERERQWLLFAESDPQTAQQTLSDRSMEVERMLAENGAQNVDQSVIDYIAQQFTFGHWSQTMMQTQITALTDPEAGYELDASLAAVSGGVLEDTNRAYEDYVTDEAARWLGPVFGENFDTSYWAGKIRNTPDGQAELEAELQRQRMALLPEYENPNLTYNDIASPWKGVWQQTWGQTPDETDPLFMDMLRQNDLTEAGKMLTQEGLNRNIGKVVTDTEQAMRQAFGDDIVSI